MLFFSTHNKSCSGCIFSSLFTPSGSPKSCGGENESTANNRCSGENIFHFRHLGKKLMKELGLPKYQWGALVPPASQVLASICLKGTACVTCQLLRKGTKGTDSCILFWFPSNYVNDKKTPERSLAPSMIHQFKRNVVWTEIFLWFWLPCSFVSATCFCLCLYIFTMNLCL